MKGIFMEVVCAWCKKILGFKDAGQGDKPVFCISHGICSECARKEMGQVKIPPQQNPGQQSSSVRNMATANG